MHLPIRPALFMALLVTASSALAANASFSDVSATYPYARAIGVLKGQGMLQGYEDGTFHPTATINRAEFLKIVTKAALGDAASTPCSAAPYTDVPADAWFAPFVCAASVAQIINGYPDGTFRPDQPVTFVEAAKIFALAYKQSMGDQGGEWYEPYGRALETSKAIPNSISGLEKQITRGEMAEMMWRLSQNITNQPSVGLANVQYPTLGVNLASDSVQHATSCADLQVLQETSQPQYGLYMRNTAVPEAGAMAPSADISTSQDFSKTNVQVEGVDEGDSVKTDGTYLYVISPGSVSILKANPGSALQRLSSITDTGGTFLPENLYIDGDRLAVIGSSYMPYGGVMPMDRNAVPSIYPPIITRPPQAVARIYDVSDRSHPTLIRTVSFDGSMVSTRLIGDRLYLVVNQAQHWAQPMQGSSKETDVLPQYTDSVRGSTSLPIAQCSDVMILPHVPSPQYLTVGMLDLAHSTADVQRTVVLGNAQTVYASLQNLYVATQEWLYHWDATQSTSEQRTNIYRFSFTENGTKFAAQGFVPGQILNQFSMDEQGTTFRIATTTGQSWDTEKPSVNNLYVLNMDLSTVGSLENVAPGESIYAVRFMGDRAYLVTFQSIDPLFVIDTSDPRNPHVLGALHIPGYSSYLHPFDATHLIGFGKDVDVTIDADKVHNSNAVYYTAVQGMKIAMFDVSDVNNPKQLWNTIIGDRGTDSPLLSDHRALLFEGDTGLLAFPITVYKRDASQQPSEQGKPTFQGAYVYNVSLARGFELRGTITQYPSDTFKKAGDYWYDLGNDVQRILRIGKSLLTASQGAVQSNALSSLQQESSITLPNAQPLPTPCGAGLPCIQE